MLKFFRVSITLIFIWHYQATFFKAIVITIKKCMRFLNKEYISESTLLNNSLLLFLLIERLHIKTYPKGVFFFLPL